VNSIRRSPSPTARPAPAPRTAQPSTPASTSPANASTNAIAANRRAELLRARPALVRRESFPPRSAHGEHLNIGTRATGELASSPAFARIAALTPVEVEVVPARDVTHAPFVGVHCFDMPWTEIEKRIPKYAEMGVDSIQIPPVFPHWKDDQGRWWQVYQPTRFDIIGETAMGSSAEFQSMVKAAKAHGIRLIGDLVINHRAGASSGTDTTGARFERGEYPDGTDDGDFHRAAPGESNGIRDYSNRWEVQNRELVGLDDFATEKSDVRLRIAAGIALCSLEGLDAFRVDAAKHMPAEDLKVIFPLARELLKAIARNDTNAFRRLPAARDLDEPTRKKILAPLLQRTRADVQAALADSGGKFWLFSEVIDMGGEAISASEYEDIGAVTEFKFCRIADYFRTGKLADLQGLGGVLQDDAGNAVTAQWWDDLLPSDKAVVVVSNHDNQRGHGGGGQPLTFKEPRLYELAHVFMLGWPYGTPVVMSSYDFSSTDEGRPEDKKEWINEDKWPAIAGMMGFRRATADQPANNWWSNGEKAIGWSRGDKGFVAINNEDHDVVVKAKTPIKDGTYDNLAAAFDDEKRTITVKGGFVELTMKPQSAISFLANAVRVDPATDPGVDAVNDDVVQG
jgi:alpha-amylase